MDFVKALFDTIEDYRDWEGCLGKNQNDLISTCLRKDTHNHHEGNDSSACNAHQGHTKEPHKDK